MAVNINDFKSYTEFISNKIQSGGTLTIPQFNQVAFQAEMQLFNKDYETFVTTKNITDFLKTFLKNKILPVNSGGEASFPVDFQYAASMRHYYVPIFGGASEVEVKEEMPAVAAIVEKVLEEIAMMREEMKAMREEMGGYAKKEEMSAIKAELSAEPAAKPIKHNPETKQANKVEFKRPAKAIDRVLARLNN